MIRVLVVDDQPLVRAGLGVILSGQPDIELVGEAIDGETAIDAATRLLPDVILMDIRMPIMDGLEATRQIVGGPETAHCKVLALTTFDVEEYVYEAIRGGASGFLLKEAPPEQILAAIRLIAAGDALVAPVSTRRLIEHHARPEPAQDPGLATRLTAREQDVLRLLASGLSNAEIAEALHLTEGTVKTHVTHILMKIDARDRVQAVVKAYEWGWVRPGERLKLDRNQSG